MSDILEKEFEEYVKKEIPDSFPDFNWSFDDTEGVILDADALYGIGTIALVKLEAHISLFNFKTRHKRNETKDNESDDTGDD